MPHGAGARRRAAAEGRVDRLPARAGAAAQGRSGQAPWGSFPLTELVVLLGLLLAVGGLIVGVEGGRGRTMFAAGIVLGALGGLEIVVRDHFAGYRSHTTLLSGVAAFVVITAAVLVLGEVALRCRRTPRCPRPWWPAGSCSRLVFRQLRRLFQSRSGGLSYR